MTPILPAKPFYMIRHGQTDANAARICSGGTEATLTPEGEAQAAKLGQVMEQVAPRPDLLIHSGRSRTIATAGFVNARLGLPVACDPFLDEHNFGDWIGQPTDPHVEWAFSGRPVPGGEDMATFAARIRKAISDILHRVDGIPLLVAHGGLFRAISHLYDAPVWRSGNCVLYYFEPAVAAFPWRIWRHQPEGETLRRSEVNLATDDPGAWPGVAAPAA